MMRRKAPMTLFVTLALLKEGFLWKMAFVMDTTKSGDGIKSTRKKLSLFSPVSSCYSQLQQPIASRLIAEKWIR